MRISDWSSDVCSSDLRPGHALPPYSLRSESYGNPGVNAGAGLQASEILARHHAKVDTGPPKRLGMSVATFASRVFVHDRSEEHTSELQSLMRISYAVFCLKKKKQPHRTTTLLTTL